ncbi:MAG: hypothetical protein ACREUF_10675, partial [Solimonas sp.]
MSTVAQWLSTLVLVGAAIAVLIKAGRAVAVFFARIGQFFDDWFGEPERPGIAPARPGVLARIA